MYKEKEYISNNDLEHILVNTINLWGDIANKTVLITGGTGFFGKWLLESLIYINNKLSLNIQLYVLSRNHTSFLKLYPQFISENIHYIKGDIRNFKFPDVPLHYIIHAATQASASLIYDQPMLMFNTIVDGTKHILELARIKKVESVLHTSSGAVYGKQPSNITHINENLNTSPNVFDSGASYGEGKRVAEMLSTFYYNQYGVNSKIARCFAFVGPYLPLDQHFAIGNFIAEVLNKKPIVIKGDGSAYRSYLYASDLIIWLWTILLKGNACRPYNVGSDEPISIAELANTISTLGGNNVPVNILGDINVHLPPERYVPLIDRAKNELGLNVNIKLDVALQKTYDFYFNISNKKNHKIN